MIPLRICRIFHWKIILHFLHLQTVTVRFRLCFLISGIPVFIRRYFRRVSTWCWITIRSISSHVARYRFWKSTALPALLWRGSALLPLIRFRNIANSAIWICISMTKKIFSVLNRFCIRTAIWTKKNFLIIIPLIAIRLKRQDAAFFWSCITVWLEYISINLRTSWSMKSFPLKIWKQKHRKSTDLLTMYFRLRNTCFTWSTICWNIISTADLVSGCCLIFLFIWSSMHRRLILQRSTAGVRSRTFSISTRAS